MMRTGRFGQSDCACAASGSMGSTASRPSAIRLAMGLAMYFMVRLLVRPLLGGNGKLTAQQVSGKERGDRLFRMLNFRHRRRGPEVAWVQLIKGPAADLRQHHVDLAAHQLDHARDAGFAGGGGAEQ